MNDVLNYTPQPRILITPKPNVEKKPPFGLFIASFSLTFMAIFAFVVSSEQNDSASTQVENFNKTSKKLMKPITAKLKKFNG